MAAEAQHSAPAPAPAAPGTAAAPSAAATTETAPPRVGDPMSSRVDVINTHAGRILCVADVRGQCFFLSSFRPRDPAPVKFRRRVRSACCLCRWRGNPRHHRQSARRHSQCGSIQSDGNLEHCTMTIEPQVGAVGRTEMFAVVHPSLKWGHTRTDAAQSVTSKTCRYSQANI